MKTLIKFSVLDQLMFIVLQTASMHTCRKFKRFHDPEDTIKCNYPDFLILITLISFKILKSIIKYLVCLNIQVSDYILFKISRLLNVELLYVEIDYFFKCGERREIMKYENIYCLIQHDPTFFDILRAHLAILYSLMVGSK